MTVLEALRSDLPEDELIAAGYFADQPATKPLPSRYDPLPDHDVDLVTECGLMGEDREGVWSALHLDLVLDLEPELWGVVDEYATTSPTKLTAHDWATRSAKAVAALETLIAATHRERRRRGDDRLELEQLIGAAED